MEENEIKEDCLQEAGIDLGRYSHTELTQIKDAMRRYHNAKLKNLNKPDNEVKSCQHSLDISFDEPIHYCKDCGKYHN